MATMVHICNQMRVKYEINTWHTLYLFFQLGIATVSHQRITLTEVSYEAARDEDIRWRQIRHSNILIRETMR